MILHFSYHIPYQPSTHDLIITPLIRVRIPEIAQEYQTIYDVVFIKRIIYEIVFDIQMYLLSQE